MPEWVITAMNSIGEKSIGFEEGTKVTEDPGTLIESGPDPEDSIGAQEQGEDDWGDIPEHVGEDDIDEVNEAIRVLEEADIQANLEEEPHDGEVNTRSRIDRNAFNNEVEADRYAEYVAMGWREPEPQDIGKVVFNRNFRRCEANLIRARKVLRDSHLSRHNGNDGEEELANIYFDQAMTIRSYEAWEALLKEVLKGDSKSIWHGKRWEDLTPEQRKLVLPMMKNYIEKYLPSGEFEKS